MTSSNPFSLDIQRTSSRLYSLTHGFGRKTILINLNDNVNENLFLTKTKTIMTGDRLFLAWILLAHALHSVLDLANQEVYLERRLCFRGLQVGHHDVGKHLTEVLHLGSLLFLIGLLMQLEQLTLQLTHLCKGFDDGEGHGPGSLTFDCRLPPSRSAMLKRA